jgi:hypothetical protein
MRWICCETLQHTQVGERTEKSRTAQRVAKKESAKLNATAEQSKGNTQTAKRNTSALVFCYLFA